MKTIRVGNPRRILQVKVLASALMLLSISLDGHGGTNDKTRLLYSFENAEEQTAFVGKGVAVSLESTHALEGKQSLRLEFVEQEWPKASLRIESPLDWSAFGGVALEVSNPNAFEVSYGVRIDDDPNTEGGTVHVRSGTGTLAPGVKETVLVPFIAPPESFGMKRLPTVGPFKNLAMSGPGVFDSKHIYDFQIFMPRPKEGTVLLVDTIRLAAFPPLNLKGIVDAFGQYSRVDWPGKLKKKDELAAQATEEEAALQSHPSLPDRDGYGGWTKGPLLKATGFFRTEKIKSPSGENKWWLVDPEGRLFLSVGPNAVSLREGLTGLTGREYMFEKIPATDDPLAKHFAPFSKIHSGPVKEGVGVNFYEMNLERKFGPDYQAKWREVTLRRFLSWGFNTVAGFSDISIAEHKFPYTAHLSANGSHQRISDGLSGGWSMMDDPFDPQFAIDAANDAARRITDSMRNDPFLIGYFSGNEGSWGRSPGTIRERYGLVYGTLKKDGTSYAKQAMIRGLKAKYGAIAKLNEAWGTRFTSWDALDASYLAPEQPVAAMQTDFSEFLKQYGMKYFSTFRDVIKKVDPNHLYLGVRFARHTPEIVEAAGMYCDVVSFNIYKKEIGSQWDFLKTLDKPCLVSEFHFGAVDRGMFSGGLVEVENQIQRAASYQKYLRSMADHPAFVGCQWFQYTDEPTTGRVFDGENFNIGFVSVTDRPYSELVQAARIAHEEMYARRYGEPAVRGSDPK